MEAAAVARQLLSEVMSCPVGAARATVRRSSADMDAVDHSRMRKWVAQQHVDYAAAAYAGEVDGSGGKRFDEMSEDDMFEALENAQRQLTIASEERFNTSLLIDRLRKSAILTRATFQPHSEPPAGVTVARAAQRDELSLKYGDLHRNVHDLREELENVQAEIQRLRVQAREDVTALQGAPSQPASAQKSGAMDAVQAEITRNVIIRNVFQIVVVASGIDWSEDPELCRAMLSCEQPAI